MRMAVLKRAVAKANSVTGQANWRARRGALECGSVLNPAKADVTGDLRSTIGTERRESKTSLDRKSYRVVYPTVWYS